MKKRKAHIFDTIDWRSRRGGILGLGLPKQVIKNEVKSKMDDNIFKFQYPQDFADKEASYFDWLKKKCGDYDVSLVEICNDADVGYSTLMTWRLKNPKSLDIANRIERALEMHRQIKEQRESYRQRGKGC